ncbi:MAG TPA: FMN-binding protein [Candidatus Saccharimonadales bacterium]|nr:FMN-binding protein [Candidatus Saccharimonadales bacterium]
MPIRAVVTLAATILVLVLLVSFRTPPSTSVGTLPVLPPAASSSHSPTPATTPAGSPPAGGGSPTPTPNGTGLRNGSFTGTDFPNFYGDVQVKVVVSGGRITDIVPLQYPTDRPQSAYISSVAVPLLHDEVLKAQSAQIDIISGATFTSDSYAQSVQSALDRARA